MKNFIIITQDLGQGWLKELSHAWPSLLVLLLDQEHGESLERLQLISCGLELISSTENIDSPNIKRTTTGVDNFLVLEAMLRLDASKTLKISVNYFVRGARKYFKTPLIEALPSASLPVKKIEALAIKDFFEKLGQENSFFYDRDLAVLNGYAEIMVPTQAIIAWLVNYALGMWQDPLGNATFSLNFYGALFADQELSLGQELDDHRLRLALYAQDKVAVVLNANI